MTPPHRPPANQPAPLDPRKLQYELIPVLERGAPVHRVGPGLLALDPALGVGIRPLLRRPGAHRAPTTEELAAIRALGVPLGELYRRNLARLLREVEVTAVGNPEGLKVLALDPALPWAESVVLLPELWDRVESICGRPVWLALPARGHCRFVPAGPWRVAIAMAPELQRWFEEGAEPLFDRYLRREQGTLIGGPRFADLAREH